MGTSIEEQKVLSGADPFDVYNHNNIHKGNKTKHHLKLHIILNIIIKILNNNMGKLLKLRANRAVRSGTCPR